MFVVRLAGENLTELADSRPCARCVLWLKHYGIRRVYYSVRMSTGQEGEEIRGVVQLDSGEGGTQRVFSWRKEFVAEMCEAYLTRAQRLLLDDEFK